MKNLLAFICILLAIQLSAQDLKKKHLENFELGFGMAINYESLDPTVAEETGVSSHAFTWIDFRGRLGLFKYAIVDIGFSVSQFKDELPFTEAVVYTSGTLSGLPTTASSKIVSGSMYYSIGGRAPLTERLYLNATVGQRRYSATRSIPECSDCRKTDIDLEAGSYLRGGFSWMTFEESAHGEFDLLYTYYFDGDFKSTITLGFFVYF